MLPKFLLADNSQELPETLFVIHNEQPRFIVSFDVDNFSGNQKIHWIDDEPNSEKLISDLMDLAEEFMETELENQEELYDEDEDGN